MQTRRPLSLVTKTTTQKQNNTNEFFKMEQATQEKQTRTKA